MKKTYEQTVRVNAPVEHVYAAVADFEKHPDWDRFTKKVEPIKAGDARGVGAEWKVYEQLGLFAVGQGERDPKHLSGLAKRQVTEVVPNRRVQWHTHPVPRLGISGDVTYEFAADGGATQVTFKIEVNAPSLMERLTKVVMFNLENRQQAQWQAALEGLKGYVEAGKPAMATA